MSKPMGHADLGAVAESNGKMKFAPLDLSHDNRTATRAPR